MFGLKNLFAIVGLAVVAFVAAGWYLGWYKIAQHNNEIEIHANPGQIKNDIQKGVKAVEKVIEDNKGAYTPTDTVHPPVPTGVPSLPPMPQPPAGISLPSLPSLPPMPALPSSNNSSSSAPLPPVPQPVESWILKGG